MNRSMLRLAALVLMVCASAAVLRAQDDDDAVFRQAEPDFTLVTLPTPLPVPLFKGAFRVTHRFTKPWTGQDFGDLAASLFSIDNGAQIGLEYRFGVAPHAEIGFYRTSNRTIQLFAQYDLLRQSKGSPIEVAAWGSLDGTNNLRGNHSPGFGAIVSRRFGGRAAVYAEPIWVRNTNLFPTPGQDVNTFLVGLGARVRVRPTVYVVAETAPRASGYRPGVNQTAFAIEKHVGGHMFQLNFSNSFGSTMGQIALGGPASNDWFLGFNISRKFF